MPESVFKKSVANVTRARKHGENCEKDFKAVKIVAVCFDCQSKKDIVESRQNCRGCDTIYEIREHRTSTIEILVLQ